jgi:anti-sigma factor RsiW
MTDQHDIPSHEAELQAYFDGELDERATAAMKARIADDPELQQHIAHMGLMRDLVGHSLEMRAVEVPRARFEQIWDEIDRVIDQETKQARATAQPPASLWARLGALLRPFRIPLLAAAGAAAVAIIAVQLADSGAVNQDTSVASAPETPAPKAPAPGAQPKPETRIAKTEEPPPSADDALPLPHAAEADIQGIQFGGKNGRISHNGVSTVLYVEEDDEPKKSERSL